MFLNLCACVSVCLHVHMCTHIWNFFTRYRQSLILCESVWLFAIPGTVALQAPLSIEFSRQEYWSGLPCPFPGKSCRSRDQAQVSHIAGVLFTSEPPGKLKDKIHTVMEELCMNLNLVYVLQISEELVKSVMLYSTKTTWTRT